MTFLLVRNVTIICTSCQGGRKESKEEEEKGGGEGQKGEGREKRKSFEQ